MIDMNKKIKAVFIVLFIAVAAVNFASAQNDSMPKIKLRSGAAVSGVVGGEGHTSYVIRVRKGQTINVMVSRRVPKSGNFNLTVSRNANFFEAKQVKFGKETSGRNQLRWTGKAPADGNYYFYLTGFAPNEPNNIRYRLTATVK